VVTPAGGSASTFTSPGNQPFLALAGLTANTVYTFQINAVDGAGRKSSILTGTLTTGPTDAANDPKKDLQNVACSNNTLTAFNRAAINCSWTLPAAPAVQPFQIHTSARCHSVLQRNRHIIRLLPAGSTNVTFNVGRTSTVCHIQIRAHYHYPWNTPPPHSFTFGHIFSLNVTISSKA